MKIKTQKQKGFTLVELLVVIGIVAALASISIPIGMRMINSARVTSARTTMTNTILASNAFYEAHKTLVYGYTLTQPFGLTANPAYTSVTDAIATNNHDDFFMSLTGVNNRSKNRENYLKIDDVKEGPRDGVTRAADGTVHGLLDPWGNPYYIHLDTDFDSEINTDAALTGTASQRIFLTSTRLVMISSGRDGIFGTADDINSWQAQ